MIGEVLVDLDVALSRWQASEYPQLVPCAMIGTGANMIAIPNPDKPNFHLVFSFFCPLEKAQASPSMVALEKLKLNIRYALLNDETTAYRFWLHGYGVYTNQEETNPHGLELLINPRIPNDAPKPSLCLHCYLSEIRNRYGEEGRQDELEHATDPLKNPELEGGLVFDASKM